jgi:hypothetical protein
MGEALPIIGGIALGVLAGLYGDRVRARELAAIACLIAAAATVASGEYRVAWGYLLVDGAEVIAGAAISIAIVVWLRSRRVV